MSSLTFAMFQASGRYVEDLEKEFPGEYVPRSPGRIYAGELVIQETLGCTAGVWMLTIGNSSECSNDLAALEPWGKKFQQLLKLLISVCRAIQSAEGK